MFIEGFGCQCGMCKQRFTLEDFDHQRRYLVELDHFVPKRHQGADSLSNLWCLCPTCHALKSQKEEGSAWCPICRVRGKHPDCLEAYRRRNFDLERFLLLAGLGVRQAPSTLDSSDDVDINPFAKYAYRPMDNRDQGNAVTGDGNDPPRSSPYFAVKPCRKFKTVRV